MIYCWLCQWSRNKSILGQAYLKRETTAIPMGWGHTHILVVGRRWRRAVWGAGWPRVVLRTSPRETNSRVANRISLHLVDGHLSRMSLNELDETAALSGWDLNIGDLAEALEE